MNQGFSSKAATLMGPSARPAPRQNRNERFAEISFMSPESVSAVAAAGTLIVIAATAFAALVQLRHIRAANQLTGLLHFSAVFESDDIQTRSHLSSTI